MIIGFLIQWPTILTVFMAPVLLYAYVHLAMVEEIRAESEFGQAYNEYVRTTPAFFPPFDQWKKFLTVEIKAEQAP